MQSVSVLLTLTVHFNVVRLGRSGAHRYRAGRCISSATTEEGRTSLPSRNERLRMSGAYRVNASQSTGRRVRLNLYHRQVREEMGERGIKRTHNPGSFLLEFENASRGNNCSRGRSESIVCHRIRVAGPCQALHVLAQRARVPLKFGASVLRSCCSTYTKMRLNSSDTKRVRCMIVGSLFLP
jgi:hypothetical protein